MAEPIDSERLFRFINDRRFKGSGPAGRPYNPYGRGYNDAIDELEEWLRSVGYEPAVTN